MKSLRSLHVRPIDAGVITATIERAFASSGLETRQGLFKNITETIRRALDSQGSQRGPMTSPIEGTVIDVAARDVGPYPDTPRTTPLEAPQAPAAAPGQFVTREFSNHAGSRSYKVYIPARRVDAPMPLIVMLHGCTQSPDDFAAGTQMNHLAEEHGFLVVYPEQAVNANGSKCWNWFNVQDQARDSGEPSLLAGITREVAATHAVDQKRVYVAGLSAGAAMAVILGETYPDLYAGVGVHSGLPYSAAHDMPSAFAAMKGGRGAAAHAANLQGAAPPVSGRKAVQAVPTIVFHGDRDQTVGPRNGAQIVGQAVESLAKAHGGPLRSSTEQGTTAAGRSYSRTVYKNAEENSPLESWVLHGAGHAWSGGNASGTYTDATGPDASAEMVRFFLSQAAEGASAR